MEKIKLVNVNDTTTLKAKEVWLVADLRVLHAMVASIYEVTLNLREAYSEKDIVDYSDSKLLVKDISKLDEIYLYFIKLRDEYTRRSKDNERRK